MDQTQKDVALFEAAASFAYSDEFRAAVLDQLKDREGTPAHEQWFQMAMRRVAFQRTHFLPLLESFTTCAGKQALEIGCGTGPASVVMAERGAQVVAIDIDPKMVEAARLRVRDHGLSAAVRTMCVPSAEHLDFPDESFDLVVLNGVLEHVYPNLRAPILREVWRVLRRGGHLFIGETPNRLWPKDVHTTQLWWLHYLPLGSAARYAKLRGAIEPADDLAAMGGQGCVYSRLIGALPAGEVRVLNLERQYSWIGRRASGAGSLPKRVFLAALAVFERGFLRPVFGMPLDGLMPFLTICLEKRGS